MAIESLFPIPGSKRGSKYATLRPAPRQSAICEPFMGGAAKSLEFGFLSPYLAEINPPQRKIARVPSSKKAITDYVKLYRQIASDFVDGIDVDQLLSYVKREQSMKALRAEIPGVAAVLDERWLPMKKRLFESVQADTDDQAAPYSFMQRSCFGNVMRLNPKGTHYNVTWHVGKLSNALRFDPEAWCESLRSRQWNPKVFSNWEGAIAAVKSPYITWLLLDPPYIEADGDRKMTPCYPGHVVTTEEGREATYRLATEPLRMGLRRGFPLIHLCNYYSAKLDLEVTEMAYEYGYLCDRQMIGICQALGNSAGRYKHGGRVDARQKPTECIWTFRPFAQLNLLKMKL
jgi:site-specific DNA-adenine methylase